MLLLLLLLMMMMVLLLMMMLLRGICACIIYQRRAKSHDCFAESK